MCVPGAHQGQKRALDPRGRELTDGYELPHGWWEPNPGPLQVQPVLLAAEPPLLLRTLPSPHYSENIVPRRGYHSSGKRPLPMIWDVPCWGALSSLSFLVWGRETARPEGALAFCAWARASFFFPGHGE